MNVKNLEEEIDVGLGIVLLRNFDLPSFELVSEVDRRSY